MAEEEKPKQLVQMSTVVASGMAAIIAALFTSRLGVAGTLIGTALTPMLMTIGVAVLNAQIAKATERISDLPTAVRGRLPTQRVRVPGALGPEDRPEEPEPPVATRRRDRRTPGVFERLLSVPTFLKELSPSTRRRTLLTGALAGLAAAAIGLVGVTGVEVASGNTLSCSVWNDCAPVTAASEPGGTRPSVLQPFGGPAETQNAPTGGGEQPAADVQQQEEARPAPDGGGSPRNGQYEDGSRTGSEQEAPSGETPAEPTPAEPTPQEAQPPAQGPDAIPPYQDGSQGPAPVPGVEQAPAAPYGQQ